MSTNRTSGLHARPDRWLLAATMTAALATTPMLSSCSTIDCGDGTIERDGTCVPGDVNTDETQCGTGTHLGDDGKCVANFPQTVCQQGTTEQVTDPVTGIITCVGTGGTVNCDLPLACPAASPNKVTICGQLLDVTDDTPIRAAAPTGAACNQTDPEDTGPCSLELQFYDAIDFANNPAEAAQLPKEELFIDDCGRFRARNVNRPGLGFLGIGIDDHAEGTVDVMALTGVATAVASAETRPDFPAYVVPKTTDAMWLASSGIGGLSFEERGVFMPIFRVGETPHPGVVIIKSGAPSPNNDYYFDDTVPTSRTSIDPALTETGVNGAGLMLLSNLVEHSGDADSAPAGCSWPSDLAASLPGVVFVTRRDAENTATGEPCE